MRLKKLKKFTDMLPTSDEYQQKKIQKLYSIATYDIGWKEAKMLRKILSCEVVADKEAILKLLNDYILKSEGKDITGKYILDKYLATFPFFKNRAGEYIYDTSAFIRNVPDVGLNKFIGIILKEVYDVDVVKLGNLHAIRNKIKQLIAIGE